ncbi:hypothetical protein E2493_19300 [Sphingomonas parva]|uniref:Type I restriction modification DNA specificity domain-containing protein n=1 Tax=Sphingomonas parva TaxID=2555898 RepID=A0A4Y8ZP52_9SPHN|nr:restriction endonuclease subunit S [Sphingomonas parva]TFI56609.1 hypothetical protein E2493_19300 [Sphingomonas parva]
MTVREVAPLVGETLDPQRARSTVFAHYSIPAYDEGRGPVLEPGSAIKSNKTGFPRGAVLFSKLNPRISRVWHVDDEQEARRICSTEFLPLHPDTTRCDGRYLAWMLRSPDFVRSIAGPSAATKSRERVKPSDVLGGKIPVPLLGEQRRIADLLDAAMTNVARARGALKRQIDDCGRLRFALTEEALGGRAIATDDKNDQPGAGWVPLSSVARLESGHTPSRKRPEWWGGDVPWLALPDIRAVDGTTIGRTIENTNELGLANSSARLLPKATVVLSRTASVGFVAVMGRPMATSQDFVNWVPGPTLRSWYLAYALIGARDYLRGLSSGAVHKTIYMPTLKSLHVRLASLEEQDGMVEQIRTSHSFTDEARAAIETQSADLDTLPTSLLSAAFRGEI